MPESNNTYVCNACGWVYDSELGDPDGGISPGTRWEDIPDDWVCPVCGVGKEDFECLEQSSVAEAESADSSSAPLVIIGSGLAGYSLAKELRKHDAALPVTIITGDGGEVYTKPMLSNAFAHKYQADDLIQMDAVSRAEELNIEIITRTRVLAIDKNNRHLTLQGTGQNKRLSYDRLVLALGAEPRIFPVEGQELIDVSTVNNLDDYRHWRERLIAGKRILLIGAGLIGCEFANDLASVGFQVAIIDPSAWPLARLLPEEIGCMLDDALQQEGCSLHLGCTVTRYTASKSGFQAELNDGAKVDFDHALSAVGLAPCIDLAREAGLDVQSGILVDRFMRTNDSSIFALGDCAQTEVGPLPFIAPLLAEARVLAKTLTGNETKLHLSAMPVVVKTPALPLVVCSPPAGVDGSWEVEKCDNEAVAVYRTLKGTEVGFVLAGSKTKLQQSMVTGMPDVLENKGVNEQSTIDKTVSDDSVQSYECDICAYIYDPKEGDPDGGISPGTRWEDIPDDWICPTCGAGKGDFTVVS